MTDLDLEERQLCPDGACIGVIGDNGRCKVCGQAGDGPAPARREAEAVEPEANAPAPATSAAAATHAAGDDDIDSRELCPDGACIGVIGDDGKCKVCGKAAAS